MHTKATLFATIALMLLSPAVHAAMDIYGAAHVSLDYAGNDDPDPAHEDRTVSLTSNQSYIGLRGREVLQNQLAAFWQFESTISMDSGGWGDGRDTFVGLQTRFGSALFGKHATPYRRATEELDIFADTRADYNAVIGSIDGQSLFNNRADNVLLYQTPEEWSLHFALAYSPRVAGEDDLPLTTAESRQNALSAALMFDSGPLFLSLGYESLGELTGPGLDDGRAMKFGAGWDFGQGTNASFIWEDAETGEIVGGNEVRREAYYVNLAHIHGNMTYKFAYGWLDELDSAPDSGAQYVALGGSYAASARTELYLLYTAVMNDEAGSYGLQPDHDGTGAVAAIAGGDVGALSAGLVHRFDAGF
jgi:predicted porin